MGGWRSWGHNHRLLSHHVYLLPHILGSRQDHRYQIIQLFTSLQISCSELFSLLCLIIFKNVFNFITVNKSCLIIFKCLFIWLDRSIRRCCYLCLIASFYSGQFSLVPNFYSGSFLCHIMSVMFALLMKNQYLWEGWIQLWQLWIFIWWAVQSRYAQGMQI